jgi:hypothetical protein
LKSIANPSLLVAGCFIRGFSHKVKHYANRIFRELLDWRPQAVSVPRARCHFLALDVRNIPQRQIASSLRLQLTQLSGLSKFGFAWHSEAGHAQVWFWDEAELSARDLTPLSGTGANGIMPWPEPLLRVPLEDGLHLIACAQGYEAVAIEGGKLRRTRWLEQRPTEEAWTVFVRDTGIAPAKQSMPRPENAIVLARPAKGWKVSTHLVKPIPARTWGGIGAATLGGMALIAGGIYEIKLDEITQSLQAETQQLMKDNATTIALQKQIDKQGEYINVMSKTQQGVLQLILMKRIAESGLVGTATHISIAEWEYRNDRLRILFSIPESGFSLSEFLTKLERQSMFKEIHLMPDTPPGTVGIQATLASDAGRPGVSAQSTAPPVAETAGSPSSARRGATKG